MTKKDITKKIFGIGAGLALGALPIISNAQSIKEQQSLQRGVNAPTYAGETPTHILYHFDFNKDLEKAIKTCEKPEVYVDKSHSKDSYLVLDSDTSGYTLYYNKKNFDESGRGRDIILTVRELGKVGVCPKDKLGSNESALPSFKITPILSFIKKSAEPAKESHPGNITNITIDKDSHDVYNYFYGDTSKAKEAQQKLSHLELRTLIEGFKTGKGPYAGGTVAALIGNNNFGIGPYGTYRFGSEKESTTEPVYNKRLLSQPANIFTETEGVRTQTSKVSYPWEAGLSVNLNTNDDFARVEACYGLVNKVLETRGIQESGFDRKLVGDNIIEEKPYGPIYIEEGKKSSKWVPTQKIGLAIQPSKKVPIYIKAEAQHIGKLNSIKKGDVFVNGAIGGNIRWRKK